ncbi:hypothetical protein O181_036046 [Austropuccinia psidii MF-1]|uniref:Uncharacterized protein n=1 Tax=Austropuccinia psidii MF-1 TaxID=1389203 RepID=A0A9Q3H9J5_9BASI|nr:hypothetical protein [Austropuccinia psidii MF-1]
MARITELKNEGPKSKSPLKKVKFDTEEKKHSSKKINESKYNLKEDEPEQFESLLASSKKTSSLDNKDPLLHPKFENTHSSNMEASTIQVEPVQQKGLKSIQLVKCVSNKYGKNGTYWKKKKDAVSNDSREKCPPKSKDNFQKSFLK